MHNKTITVLIIATILSISTASAYYNWTDTVSYYKLDETTGTTAYDAVTQSGNNLTASDERIFTAATQGIINTSANLSQGNDYLNITSPVNFPSGADARTFAFFFHTPDTLVASREYLGGWGNAQSNQAFEISYFGTDTPDIFIDLYGTGNGFPVAWTPNTTYGIIVTYNGSGDDFMIYINNDSGTMVSDIAVPETVPTYFGLGYRASEGTGGGAFFNGWIDEVAIVAREWTEDERSAYFSQACQYDDTCAEPPVCTPNWVCDGYGAATCLINDTNTAACNSVNDTNSCGELYGGDYSEFSNQTGVCDYCTPSFSCDGYATGVCLQNGTRYDECDSVVDANTCFNITGLSNDTYAGDFSEFANQENECTYVDEYAGASAAVMLLLPLVFILSMLFYVPGIKEYMQEKEVAGRIIKIIGVVIALIIIGLLFV